MEEHSGVQRALAEVIGERRLRSEDMAAPDHPYSIRLGGYDNTGKAKRHYPDLLLIDPGGRRVALELELDRSKGMPGSQKIGRAISKHQQQAPRQAFAAQVGQQIDARRVGPVNVIQEDQEGSPLRHVPQKHAEFAFTAFL